MGFKYPKEAMLLLLCLLLSGCKYTTLRVAENMPDPITLDDSQPPEASNEPSPSPSPFAVETEEINHMEIEIEGYKYLVIDTFDSEQWTYYVTYRDNVYTGRTESIYQSNSDRSIVRLLLEACGHISNIRVEGGYLLCDIQYEGTTYKHRVSIDNPYIMTGETRGFWRYNVFEAFRGAEEIGFENLLEFSNEYENTIPGYETKHEFVYSISFPQASTQTSWAEQFNTYYQELFQYYAEESDKAFEECKDDWYSTGSSVNFESAYIVGSIINVVCCRSGSGWHSYSEPYVDMFSVIDGRHLGLVDLFFVEEDVYRPILEESLKKAKNRFDEYYDPEYQYEPGYEPNYDGAAEIFNLASASVTPTGLVFIYGTGRADCMAAGPVFLDVPYEDILEILNPVYFPRA